MMCLWVLLSHTYQLGYCNGKWDMNTEIDGGLAIIFSGGSSESVLSYFDSSLGALPVKVTHLMQ